jgi:lysophospholipase L1-like esterase
MEKLLIVGDSLTAGHPGSGYVSYLKKILQAEIIASGRGGDTLSGITPKIFKLLGRFTPDTLLIEIGTNDILLPLLSSRGGQWASMVKRLSLIGITITDDPVIFYENYHKLLSGIKEQYNVDIILTTVACIGENLTSAYNAIRDDYNSVIRTLGNDFLLPVADVALKFDQILKSQKICGTYLQNDYWSTLSDTFFSLSKKVIDSISDGRGLHLTIDGVHLNTRGAELYARQVMEKMDIL